MDPELIVVGALVGLMVGATGLGAAALMTPVLSIGFGVPLAIAVSTDLLYATATKLVAASRYARQGHTQWEWVAWLAVGSIPAAIASGAWLAPLVSNAALGWLMGALLLLMAAAPAWSITGQQARPAALVVAGAVIGSLVSLTSVGAGVLGTVALLAFTPMIKTASLVGTELAHALFLAGAASLTHLSLGRVDYDLLWPLLLGGVPAAYLGARVGPQLPLTWIKRIARTLMALAAIKLIVG